MAEKIEIFFCYARGDETFRSKLEKQLSTLKRQDKVIMWHDQNIAAGTDWKKEIDQHLNAAHIILLLVSPDFIASDYCFSVELGRAMERHIGGEISVIPIILRPCLWQETPFGKLQVLPTNAVPVVAWDNQDEALLNVARGIQHVVEEFLIRQQISNISLFDYEMQEDTVSPLWASLHAVVHSEGYKSWISTKRNLSKRELINQTWVKTSNPEHTFIVHFFDGGFREYALSDPSQQWQGSWELLDRKLRMRVSKYQLDIFATGDSLVYSGVEFIKGEKKPHSYFACFPLPDVNAKHWDLNVVPGLIERIFDQVLQQRVDTKLLITYGALLCRGEMTVRSIVKILGFSRNFQERFINLKKPGETIEKFYATFLGREVDIKSKLLYTKEIQLKGGNIVIADLIDGEEYQRRFGEDMLPPKVPFNNLAHILKQLKLP